MKYKLLTIVGSVLLLAGCGQTNLPVTNTNTVTTPTSTEVVVATSTQSSKTKEPTFEELREKAQKDADGNIILTSEMRYAFPGCENVESGFLPPNKNVQFKDDQRGISFSVPYNDAWKFCGYALDKYDISSTKPNNDFTEWTIIEFGGLQFMPESGSNLSRMYHLQYLPTSTPEKLMAEHKSDAFEGGFEGGVEFKKIKINNLEVLKEVDNGGLCSTLSYYVFAEKNTFAFKGYCVDMSIGGKEYSKEQFAKELEQIIKTVKLI